MKKRPYIRSSTKAASLARDRERKRLWAREHYAENYERLKEWRANRKVQVRKKSTSR